MYSNVRKSIPHTSSQAFEREEVYWPYQLIAIPSALAIGCAVWLFGWMAPKAK